MRKRTLWISGSVAGTLCLISIGIYYAIALAVDSDPFMPIYADNCGVCHGEDMSGTAQGPALVGNQLTHGESVTELVQSISSGFPQRGMPAWSQTMEASHIQSLAILIAERRVDRVFTDFKMEKALELSEGVITSELLDFHLQPVAQGIDPYPFSIAPLNDGRILLTEKKLGLSIVLPDGDLSKPLPGTPETSDMGFTMQGLDYGIGWLLDVAPHPDYTSNGWIYLHHTDLCRDCEAAEGEDGSLLPVSMNRIVRGRIRDGEWVDQEVIWQVPLRYYSTVPDIAAGGRIAFDPEGYLYFSIGIKGGYFEGVQDLRTPYGKIHRIHDDGRIPADNPFVGMAGAMPSIWTYGHRSPQGLEFDPNSRKLWGSEMGPRGGDEINLLQRGRNYGWPLYSKGVDYDGTPVEYGKDLHIEFNLADIEQPVVDLTPSPAISSFVIYQGEAFPQWRGQFLAGSLKATELYRFVIENDRLVHTEVVLKNLARIRDIEVGEDGLVYLLLEHESGSQIVRLAPQP